MLCSFPSLPGLEDLDLDIESPTRSVPFSSFNQSILLFNIALTPDPPILRPQRIPPRRAQDRSSFDQGSDTDVSDDDLRPPGRSLIRPRDNVDMESDRPNKRSGPLSSSPSRQPAMGSSSTGFVLSPSNTRFPSWKLTQLLIIESPAETWMWNTLPFARGRLFLGPPRWATRKLPQAESDHPRPRRSLKQPRLL